MSKKYWAYAIIEPAVTFIANKDEFVSNLSILGREENSGFYYLQYINENEISEYSSIVIEGSGKDFTDRVNFVKEFYNLPYSYESKRGEVTRFLFIYDRPQSIKRQTVIQKLFEKLIQCTIKDAIFFDKDQNIDKKVFVEIDSINDAIAILKQSQDTTSFSGFNLNEFQSANALSISEVQVKLKTSLVQDTVLNIVKSIGSPFSLVLSVQKSVNSAMLFFNEEFGLQFEIYRDVADKYSLDGVEAKPKNVTVAKGYYRETEKGVTKITDFLIFVHYRLQGKDVKYIVSLFNPTTEEKSKKFVFENNASKNKLAEAVMKQGGFHFSGTDKDVLTIHEAVSAVVVPTIEDIAGYWVHSDKKIVVFHNGIYDLNEGKFTENVDGSPFYFTSTGKGYHITDSNGNEIVEMYRHVAPQFHSGQSKSYEDIYNEIEPLYSDNSGDIALMTACTLAGYSLYAEAEERAPLIYIGGVTGSGKSTFNEIIQRLFGIVPGTSQKFENIKNFALVHYLTNLIRFPLFMTEFRRTATMDKVSTLRSAFDNSCETKGRPDQTIVQYNYRATACIDGEEFAKDGATRTRAIMLNMKRSSQRKDFKSNIKKFKSHKYFWSSYVQDSSRADYYEAYEEWLELFNVPGVEARVKTNVALMYAGSMAFAPDRKDVFQSICMQILEEQMKDFNENGTSNEIIKVIGRYLSSGYGTYFISRDYLIIDWNGILDYVNRNRINMNLDIETYVDHLNVMWFPVDFYEVGIGMDAKMTYWVKVEFSTIPKQLLTTTEIYKAHRESKWIAPNGNKLLTL